MPELSFKEKFNKAAKRLSNTQKQILSDVLKSIQDAEVINIKTLRDLAELDARNISITEGAGILGVSKQLINDWINNGAPKNSNGSYSIPELFKWRLDRAEEKTNDVDRMLKEERIEKLKIENAISRGDYIAKDAVKTRMLSAFTAVQATIRRAIKLSAPMIIGSTSAMQNEQILTSNYNGAIKILQQKSLTEEW